MSIIYRCFATKKMRKIISLVICFALCNIMTSIAFANCGDNLAHEDNTLANKICDLSNTELNGFKFDNVQSDLCELDVVGISSSNLMQIDVNNNAYKYKYQIGDDGVITYANVVNNGDGSIDYYFKEGAVEDIVTIDGDNNLFINGKEVHYNYEMGSNPDVIFKAAGNVHYHDSTSPSYGQPSDYTQGPTIINYSDIELEQNIAKYTKAALSAVIVWAVPACKLIASVLAGYIIGKATTDEKKAKSLSVKTEINYHKKSKAGWLNGDYCRQLKAKWYYEKGYKKYATKGTVYKCGYVIN